MAPKSTSERRARAFATSTRPASTVSTPEPAPNVLELNDHQDLPAHDERPTELKTEHGPRSARKIGNQRQKERRKPKKKEQEPRPVASELSSRLPRPTATTPTTSAQPPVHWHSSESRDKFRQQIMERNATVLSGDRQAKLQPKHRDDAPSPAPAPSPQQIELNGLVNEPNSTWPPWRDQEKSALRPPSARHLLKDFNRIFPSPANLTNPASANRRISPTLEQVQKAIPVTGIVIEDLFQRFEAHGIHNTGDDFEALLFQAGFYDEPTIRFYPTALDAWEAKYGMRTRDEVDKIIATTPTLGVLAADPGPVTDRSIESRSTEVGKLASALVRQQETAGWSLFMPSTDDMTAGFPTAEEIKAAVSERGIRYDDLIDLFAHRWSGESEAIRLATLLCSMVKENRATGLCMLWKPYAYPHFGPADPTAWTWMQDETTSAWCVLNEYKKDVAEDTMETPSAVEGSREIVQTPRYDRVLSTVLFEEEEGSDGLGDFDVVDGSADSRSPGWLDSGAGSGDTGSAEGPLSIIGDSPVTKQTTESTDTTDPTNNRNNRNTLDALDYLVTLNYSGTAAANLDVPVTTNTTNTLATTDATKTVPGPSKSETSKLVTATPPPRARAGERPSPGWTVGNLPWLSPGPEEDEDDVVPSSPLGAVFDSATEQDQEKVVNDGTLLSDAQHEPGKFASEIDYGMEEQQLRAFSEQMSTVPRADEFDEVTALHEQGGVALEPQLPALDKQTTSMIQTDAPSTSQQNEATTVVNISPLPTPKQSHPALFTAENAMPAPGTPAQTPTPNDNSEWQDIQIWLESEPESRPPKRTSAHYRRRTRNKVRLMGRRAAAADRPHQSRLHNRARDGVAERAFAEDFVATACWLVVLGVVYALCTISGN
ncbi:hypothetical protein LTR91_016761 [Friedmanniomyces endolithicus]|uniref:Uncharacterized protein n=1 Tax=Friedmanniomyces endolithicus TaxID=329885 RepID=A0AAN6QK83_9PEZI|nr:hypothetical protein LTR59_012293 [Friedmanniomyces endolithicus]KAK0800563.1 hypothetical protein LTR38_007164 [Friedmanniomyces endolithicus]KAK0809908.1 hypothetical protein LTR75_005765 [Friedmanniomyces endolithicus]KAK0837460.1 hypothetical protein LTR03_012782 [Friedmanniomyces endolithicus]KAK0871774.1 hypothetical protein LTR87_012702 [Friedmanniomyces endolithicus]